MTGAMKIREAVIDAGMKTMREDGTPEEAVKEVMDRMELYLSE